MRQKNETNESIAEMSSVMIKNIFENFKKYNDRDEMLMAKWALKKKDGEMVVTKFPISDIESYKSRFVDKLMQINNMNDMFMFEKYAKGYRIESMGGSNKEMGNGWFYPISFWDKMWSRYKIIKSKEESNNEVESRIDQALANI